jgi:hypothetical protein
VYVLPTVSPATVIGVPAPAAVLVTPPLPDLHVAVYFGVLNGLPFACVPDNFAKATSNLPATGRLSVGLFACAGAPTTIDADAADDTPVPIAFVALALQV